jgi:hypothetical protein
MLITDPASYESYFESIAKTGTPKLTALQDFYTGGVNEIQQSILSDLSYPCLWLESPSVPMSGIGRDNENVMFMGAFVILINCDPNDFALKRSLQQQAFVIACDVISKMKEDYINRDLNIDPSFTLDPIDSMLIDSCAGYRVEFKINNSFSICYDDSKWS